MDLPRFTPSLNRQAASWTPTFTFATPGDLSVSYATQIGRYRRIGKLIYVNASLKFTPTHSTASGSANFDVPIAFNSGQSSYFVVRIVSSMTWPTGATNAILNTNSGTKLILQGMGTGIAAAAFTPTNFASGVQYDVRFSGVYDTD